MLVCIYTAREDTNKCLVLSLGKKRCLLVLLVSISKVFNVYCSLSIAQIYRKKIHLYNLEETVRESNGESIKQIDKTTSSGLLKLEYSTGD